MNKFNIKKTYTGYIPNNLKSNQVFVFGANPEGKHGGGTALLAVRHHGAIYGKGRGLMGQSYGIVTTDLRIKGRPNVDKSDIIDEIVEFYSFCETKPYKEFLIAYTGGNDMLLSGFTPKEIADMFYDASNGNIPNNVIFEERFYDLVHNI